jgi:hypothetical protein
LHQDVADECQAEYDIIFDPDEADVSHKALNFGLGECISIDVIHDVHEDLFRVERIDQNY